MLTKKEGKGHSMTCTIYTCTLVSISIAMCKRNESSPFLLAKLLSHAVYFVCVCVCMHAEMKEIIDRDYLPLVNSKLLPL